MKKTKEISFLCFILLFGVFSCSKEEENPYDSLIYPDYSDTSSYVTANHSITGLHNRIFSPLCANSGCHDGTLEPDFRTIESTYNTLVYHPIIKDNPSAPVTFTYRVLPGDTTRSMLYHRMTVEFGEQGQKNIMPLGGDPDEKLFWNQNKQQFLSDIRRWIDEGAKDMFGNTPSLGNFEPEIKGMVAYADGSAIPLERNGNSLIQVPLGTQNIEIWYSYDDDVTPVQNISNNKAKFSTLAYNFDSVNEQSITYTNSPITELGFKNIMIDFYHHITINVGSYVTDQILYNRVYIQDGNNAITEIPSDGTDFSRIRRYAFEFN